VWTLRLPFRRPLAPFIMLIKHCWCANLVQDAQQGGSLALGAFLTNQAHSGSAVAWDGLQGHTRLLHTAVAIKSPN